MNYLRCDAPHCDHYELIDGVTKDMIGKPCPKCGANLLTEQDYRIGRRIEFVIKILKFLRLAKDPVPGDRVPEGQHLIRLSKDDNGKYSVKEINLND